MLKKAKLKTTSVWYKSGRATRMEAPPAGEEGWKREGNLRMITVADRQKLLLTGETLHRPWYARYGASNSRIGAFLRPCAALLSTERGREGSGVYSIPRKCELAGWGGTFRVVVELTVDELLIAQAYQKDLSDWCDAIDWSAEDSKFRTNCWKIHAWQTVVQLRELGRA